MRTTYPSSIDVTADTRDRLVQMLNSNLARCLHLFLESKYAHWNLKGRYFYSFHTLIDEIANDMREHADLVAERIAALGGLARGTPRQIADARALPEYDYEAVSAEQHASVLVRHLSDHARAVREAAQTDDGIQDIATQDLLMDQLREVEKDLWLLETHLQSTERVQRADVEGEVMAHEGEPAHI